MPFTDNVSSISGRNSRASNISGATGTSRSFRSPPPPMGAGGDTLANAGVLSMLKTSTDTGDIGALSFNSSRLPSMPHRAGQRRQHPSRMSGSSHQYAGGQHSYAPSMTSRVSSATREWDTASNGRRGSMTSMQTMPTFVSDTQPSGMSHQGRPMGLGPVPGPEKRDSRSYSLTNAIQAGQLPRHKSANSLKSQGHEPRRYGPPPPMPENRGPFVYPTRLKRPGYRSPSPALSDTYAQAGPMPLQPPPLNRRVAIPPVPPIPLMPTMPPMQQMPRPPMPTYHSDYGTEYATDSAYLNVPPPHSMSHPPVMGYEAQQQQPPFTYRPGHMRTGPAMPMQQRPHPQQAHHIYGPPRQMYAATPQQMHHQMRRGPPPPGPGVAPMAHNMFHNAARLARQLPQRTDTPMNEGTPSSSDPPSSGTAPDSSSPPTPKDQTTIQVVVDPAFIDPALTDLPESTSDPVMPAKYFDYVDGLVERPADDTEIEVHHPSIPQSGFVQRVKAMLESRAAAEAAAQKDADREREHEHREPERYQYERQLIAYELEAPINSRVTVLEEWEAPVELPASPVLRAELPASPARSTRRLTRDLIKAELAASTTDLQPSTTQVTEVTETPTKQLTPSPLKPSEESTPDGSSSFEPSGLDEDALQTTPLRSSPPEVQHKGSSVAGSLASSSQRSKVSAMDYALRFSPPSETEATATDLGATETDSRDPFALDADTITAQHQEAKDSAFDSHQADTQTAPVSPLLPGEQVNRFSAVSPVQTQIFGIDETLQSHEKEVSPTGSAKANGLMPGAFPEDTQPPPTPRTPRTYSKSVHLPQPTVTPTDTTATNRLSLPADLSQIGDTTFNSTTDAMTDVAVRFSLPQTTVTIAKPQIVSIASSTPPKDEPALLRSAFHAPERQRRRGSVVTFEDEVAPLKVNKKAEQHRPSHSLGAIAPRARSQVTRGPSPFEEQPDTDMSSRENTADLRFSGINFIRNKYPSTHLPGLKEESSEDMSVHDKRRSTDIAHGLQFQLPARIAAVKAMQERRQQEMQDKARSKEHRRRHPEAGRPLGDTRDLPSLNFSRMDLIDKLNDALQIRSSKSTDILRRRDLTPIICPSPQRPRSASPMWERYTSFFNKPEDFPAEELDEESEVSEDEAQDLPKEQQQLESRRNSKAISETDSARRPLSPEERMLAVATQVNRLSIPSVNGLSERLSELLPCLKDLNLGTVLASDAEVAHTLDDIHQLGHIAVARPDTVLSTRTSAGFRTLAERAEDIVVNGTHDSIVPYKLLALNKDLPALPASMSLDQYPRPLSADGNVSAYLSGSMSLPSGLGNDLARPQSALVRARSPLTEEDVRRLLPAELNPIARGNRRSLIVSSLSSRPWNLDENYPWARSNLAIDLTVPDKAHHRETLANELARYRGTKSLDLTLPSGCILDSTGSGIDVGSITTDLDPSASVTTLQLTGITGSHTRKHSKRSIIGSIKHKIGLSRSNQDDTTTKTLTQSSGVRSASDEPSHNPGDRYPTTALTPPVGFNLDEVRSYFSDDSDEGNKDRKTPKGRRWTGLKSRNRNRAESRSQSLDNTVLESQPYDAGSINDRLGIESSTAYTFDATGMGKTEFRIKRFGEKLRVLFAKGGELIRSLSTRSRRKTAERDEWLSDSLYSGV